MLAIKGDTGVCIARNGADAFILSEGKYIGKVYRVWSLDNARHTALVAADSGDEAAQMLKAALKTEGINMAGHGFQLQ